VPKLAGEWGWPFRTRHPEPAHAAARMLRLHLFSLHDASVGDSRMLLSVVEGRDQSPKSYEYILVDTRGETSSVGVITLNRPKGKHRRGRSLPSGSRNAVDAIDMASNHILSWFTLFGESSCSHDTSMNPALNALCSPLMDEVSAALDAFEADSSIGAVVITGSERAFAAGADIKEMLPKNFVECYTVSIQLSMGALRGAGCSAILAISSCSHPLTLRREPTQENFLADWDRVARSTLPIIAAVNGFAVRCVTVVLAVLCSAVFCLCTLVLSYLITV